MPPKKPSSSAPAAPPPAACAVPAPAGPLLGSHALQALADAVGNAKLVRIDEGIAYADAREAHPRLYPPSDPAAAKLPVGAWLRKTPDGAVTGFLPEGAARAVWEVRHTAPDVAACFRALDAAITGTPR